jgi:hypothetical protein
MIRRFGPFLLVLGILWGTCAWAQTDTGTTDTSVPTQPGPKPAYTYPDTTPSLDFLSQSIENSSITLGIGGGFSYDSNANANSLGNSNFSQNWWLFNVRPSIRIQQYRKSLTWDVGYSGGYQYQTHLAGASSNTNRFAQAANASFLWQLAKHWQLQGNDNYSYSADPFESYLTTVGTPTMNNPNPVTYFPLTQFTQNNGLLTLTDQLTKVDTLSFTGTSNLRRTSTYNLLTSVPFYNLVSYGGRAAYSHQLSPRLSLGAGYDFNSLDFGKGVQRSGVQTISMTADYVIRPNMTISGWVGPEYTSTKTVACVPELIDGVLQIVCIHYSSMWSTALGANFGWQSLRNSVRLGFSRSVMDGGGIIATSQVNSVTGSYRRMLTPTLDLTFSGRYFHDVSTTVSSRSYDNFNIGAVLSYKIRKSFNASAHYSFIHQMQSNTILLGSNNYNANLVGVSLNYTWNHPLGR